MMCQWRVYGRKEGRKEMEKEGKVGKRKWGGGCLMPIPHHHLHPFFVPTAWMILPGGGIVPFHSYPTTTTWSPTCCSILYHHRKEGRKERCRGCVLSDAFDSYSMSPFILTLLPSAFYLSTYSLPPFSDDSGWLTFLVPIILMPHHGIPTQFACAFRAYYYLPP